MHFVNADIYRAFAEGLNLSNAVFDGTVFEEGDFSRACFRGATFRNTRFNKTILTNAVFDGATFVNCNLNRVNLTGASFRVEEITVITEAKSKFSMDGKGRAIDNVFIERLWRSVKYEYIYLKPPADGLELYQGLKQWFNDYNTDRRHTSLDGEEPATVYYTKKPQATEAA